jgi:hypothetical protein
MIFLVSDGPYPYYFFANSTDIPAISWSDATGAGCYLGLSGANNQQTWREIVQFRRKLAHVMLSSTIHADALANTT